MFKNFFKRAWVGFYTSIVTLILIIVCLAIYANNCNSVGYFEGTGNGVVYGCTILALIFTLVSIFLPFIETNSKLINTILHFINDVLRIVVPILLIVAFISFAGDRVEGIAYIYGSDESTLAEIQTPENLASASGAITGLVMFVVTWIVCLVSDFFAITKQPKKEDNVEVNNSSTQKA